MARQPTPVRLVQQAGMQMPRRATPASGAHTARPRFAEPYTSELPGGEPAAGQADDRCSLAIALAGCRRHLIGALAFSLALNLLYLAAPLYMMQVYDRVVNGGSAMTLLTLTLLLLIAFGALALVDAARARLITRAGLRFDRILAPRAAAVAMHLSLSGGADRQALSDLDTLRHWLGGPALAAMLDLPWSPIYLVIIASLHAALGAFALGSAAVLVTIAAVGEWALRRATSAANAAEKRAGSFTDMSLSNAEVVAAMGMLPSWLERWAADRALSLARQQQVAERSARFAALVRFLRMSMQSLILGLGAWLVIERAANPGAIFAASLLLGRMLQPVEAIVGQWRGLIGARAAARRLDAALAAHPRHSRPRGMPRPAGNVALHQVSYVTAASEQPIIHNLTLEIAAGEIVCVIGPSGAGKSTLARLIVGVLAPRAGVVRLDGMDQARIDRAVLGPHIGYLPQNIEIFADTVWANIARFATGPEVEREVLRAAHIAGIDAMIRALPAGYDTLIGPGGVALSGGWRQRIGLARAIYGNPALVVLDEPSSNLDKEGDAALARCLAELKARGTTVFVVTHRPETAGLVDKVLVLRQGRVLAFGAPRHILAAMNTLPGSGAARPA